MVMALLAEKQPLLGCFVTQLITIKQVLDYLSRVRNCGEGDMSLKLGCP